ncbi:hypothetical protein GC176_09210 [bacterium]|nr:hypothetical protein [bacterium]
MLKENSRSLFQAGRLFRPDLLMSPDLSDSELSTGRLRAERKKKNAVEVETPTASLTDDDRCGPTPATGMAESYCIWRAVDKKSSIFLEDRCIPREKRD